MSVNLGFNTFVVSDATAAFNVKGINSEVYNAELVHLMSLANLKAEYATIITTTKLIEMITNIKTL